MPTLILQCSDDVIAPQAVGDFMHAQDPRQRAGHPRGHRPLSQPQRAGRDHGGGQALPRSAAMSDGGERPPDRRRTRSSETTPTSTSTRRARSSRPCPTARSCAPTRRSSTGSAPARTTLVGSTRFQSLLSVGSRIYYETHYAPLLQMQGFVNEIALDMRRTRRHRPADRRQCAAVARRRPAPSRSTASRCSTPPTGGSYEQELLRERKRAEAVGRGSWRRPTSQKNEFIAMLAHELRNPLAPMRNAVEP